MISVNYFTYNPFQENTYVLHDETKECIIIDPGCYEQNEKEHLATFIEVENLKPVKLINTHCHIDHILGNNFIAKKYDLKLEMNKIELPLLQSTEEYGKLWGINVEPSPMPEVFLDEGGIISFGNSELEILFTPGHSPGHLIFYHKDENFAISGDVLFLQSIGRTDLPGGDHDTLISSIREKVFPLGDKMKIYPGHGPETNVGYERQHNPFL